MPLRVPLSVVAPVLAVLFALGALALVPGSRSRTPPRLAELQPVEVTVLDRSGALAGLLSERTVRIAAPGGGRTVYAGGCAASADALRIGEAVTVWLDRESRIWRIARAAAPVCTYLQATAALDGRRQTRRIAAIVLAVAGVACAVLTIVGRRRP